MGGKVFIAAGHYPTAPGAGFEGFYEHEEATRWVSVMTALDPDARVLVPVPTGTLKEKTVFINKRCDRQRDVAVEIHFNSFVDTQGNHKGSGCVSLFYPDSKTSAALANACQEVLKVHFPPDRGIAAGWYRGNELRGPYYFLAKTSCAAVILEPEFVHHRELIQSKRQEVAQALAAMLAEYVGSKL